MINKGICDIGVIWNHSNWEYEWDKTCDVGEYLKCRKKLVDKLVEECTQNIDEVKIAGMDLFKRGNGCKSSCAIYVVLIAIVFTISMGIGTYFVYYKNLNYDNKNCF